MAFILQIFISIEKAIFYVLSFISNLFPMMAGQLKTQKSTNYRETKQQSLTRSKEENFHQELQNSFKDSLSSNVTKARQCLTHDEELKRRNGQAPVNINSDKNRKQNECTLQDIIKHQTHFMGDNCNILKPVAKHLSKEEVKRKEVLPNIDHQPPTLLNKEIHGKSNIKVNTVSKHTISYMDFLQTNTDNILRLLDEIESSSKISSRKVQSNERSNKNSHSQRIDKVRKYNTPVFEALITTDKEKNNVTNKCCCVETHCCLVSVYSEDSLGGLVYDDDDDYAFQGELLTPEELSSVDTGSDEDWLYKPTKN